MEFLNKDLLSEIAKYLLCYDLINLKLALTNIDLREDTYDNCLDFTKQQLLSCRDNFTNEVLSKMYQHPILKDYVFTEKIEGDKLVGVIVVNCKLIKKIIEYSEIKPSIGDFRYICIGEIYKFVLVNIINYQEVLDEIFRSIAVTDIRQLYDSRYINAQFSRDLIKRSGYFLSDIKNYISPVWNDRDIIAMRAEELEIIYNNLDQENRSALLKSINEYENRFSYNKHMLNEFLKRIMFDN